ncbi:MAG: hypothetical protein PHF57_07740 [Methanoregula sp.]|jgi:heme/copper-type cytochrome/quinol oxidase subunit 2|nr:hypothetical protein [Methanoregula sp.]
MQIGKLKEFLFCILLASFFCFFVIGILSSISIIISLFYLSFIFEVIIIIFCVGIIVGGYISFKHLKKKANKTTVTNLIISICIIFCVVWLLFQFTIIIGIQYEYSNVRERYSNTFHESLNKNSNDYLNASWNITQIYFRGFDGTYNIKGSIIPSRNLGYIPYSIPLFEYYMNSMSGYQKLLVAQQTGNCGEFSQSVAFLLNDTTHLPTRAVNFEGIDHMMSEVEINNQWWVFDNGYLTPTRPIDSFNFSKHIPEKERNDIAYVYSSSDKGNSLLKQHGFNETNITITTIADIPANDWNGKPVKGVAVEVFSLKNAHDPLISKGSTDENGQYSIILNPDKEYWIFARYESNSRLAGLASASKTDLSNISINISISNYG